ncbi:hypothetical protein PY093_13615 [Cytobacillus sp. S13-E01]|nr:hypothetical protein [Cytobacillus sp. S13-E01]MDF0727712.1 hypothetical protein [Cytobacillus sp. S13-E01]
MQRLLGHAHVQTTIQTYIHASDETIRGSWEQAQSKKKWEEEINNDTEQIGN